MPEYCTCGAELPPDSRFCHKCGKPQRDEVVVEQAPPPPSRLDFVAPMPTVTTPLAPSFHNPIAVRVGLFVASIAALLCVLLPFGCVIWLPSAGFIAVYLYSKRTGQSLSVRSGARMGWIAGIMSFAIFTVVFTVGTVAIANQPGGLSVAFREALRSQSVPQQQLEDALQVLSTPTGQASVYIFALLFSFTVTAVFCTAGGAIGAKVLEKE
jgi:hypothetical protein